MERIRLTGLFLFITAIFLGLAAAATKTTHIDFNTPDRLVGADSPEETTFGTESFDGPGSVTAGPKGADQGMPNSGNTELGGTDIDGTGQGGEAQEKAAVQFTSVPIIYPLAGVGMLGLALWFVPATELPSKQTTRKRRKRRSTSRSRRLFGR